MRHKPLKHVFRQRFSFAVIDTGLLSHRSQIAAAAALGRVVARDQCVSTATQAFTSHRVFAQPWIPVHVGRTVEFRLGRPANDVRPTPRSSQAERIRTLWCAQR